MNGGAWWATVHGVAKSRMWLSDFTFCPSGKIPRAAEQLSAHAMSTEAHVHDEKPRSAARESPSTPTETQSTTRTNS